MNTNWAKIQLFSLLSFALGVVMCCLVCHHCGGGGCERGGGCGDEKSCHGGMGECSHHGGGEKAACCKGGGHGMGHGDDNVHVIVKELEGSNFQGDTTISIDGGTVIVHRMGDSTTVKVEMKKEEVLEHAH